MSLLQELTNHLIDNLKPRSHAGLTFSSFMDNLEIDRVFKLVTKQPNEQLLCAKLKYDAVITFDSFPYRIYDPCLVFALVMCWLESKNRDDAQFDNVNPDIDVSENDEQTAYLMIAVPLSEDITLIEDESGSIPYKGKRYKLSLTSVWSHPSEVNINAD